MKIAEETKKPVVSSSRPVRVPTASVFDCRKKTLSPAAILKIVRQTQRKGDLATARAVATFTAMGYDVSIPLTESAAYDLVVDDGRELARVQCKFVGNPRGQVDLRSVHSNSSGYVVKFTTEGAYDWLYVLDQNNAEYLMKALLPKSSVRESSGERQTRSGGRVRLNAAALKAAGPPQAGPGVRIPPAPLYRRSALGGLNARHAARHHRRLTV